MRRPLVIMMARWPGIGQGKTRLAASSSPARAAQFQRHSLKVLVARLSGDRRWDFALALTPTTRWRVARRHRDFAALALIDQGPGDLGVKMTRLIRQYQRLGRPVIIIGSDTPSVSAVDILGASRALCHHDVVFGPAGDGGYWLIGWHGHVGLGLTAGRMPALNGIRWSTQHALADTLACLNNATGQHLKAYLLRQRIDVDDALSLRAHGPIRRVQPR